ncbi:Exopolyphosphatase [Neophaeococcomyces mojaviensis]|uniref:Exopolyphosphatase n=1 Tax=Neophaeococcomyces mojaviensis TaxID=3383035 RepID=A0ACC3AGA4_9EURO|nr:Exopolyphosphatase [Knufia sp. JES_112]
MQLPINEENKMRLPGFVLGQDLASYVSQIRKVVFSKSEHQRVTVIMGNPSCDLDSFICSFVLSYFYNARPNVTKHHETPIYVPVLNLPYVETGELWRLRPEFGVAIRGAFDGLTPQGRNDQTEEEKEKNRRREQSLLEELITIHELVNNDKTIPSLRRAFQTSSRWQDQKSSHKQDLILVDHNAPSIETIAPEDIDQRFKAIGCIDHHVEEDYVPKNAEPRIVRLGIGSCMSLVADHLRTINLWTANQEHKDTKGFTQISRLALTPILIDTWDLKAPGGRTSDVDRDQVKFLDPQTGKDFNREDLFQQVQTAKDESLNMLHMQEIFARDYKSYEEYTEGKDELIIGIASVVKDLAWLAGHARGKQNLVNEIVKYAQKGPKKLELFGLLTKSGDRKEVCIFSFGERGNKAIDIFEQTAEVLQLQDWHEDDELSQGFDETIGSKFNGAWKVWWMGDTTKSRKQVAPLLRDALKQTFKS